MSKQRVCRQRFRRDHDDKKAEPTDMEPRLHSLLYSSSRERVPVPVFLLADFMSIPKIDFSKNAQRLSVVL